MAMPVKAIDTSIATIDLTFMSSRSFVRVVSLFSSVHANR